MWGNEGKGVAMHDEEVERCLAEFQPRAVRALNVSAQTGSVWSLWLVAASAIILVGGVSFWHLRQETKDAKDAASMQQVLSSTALGQSNLNAIALTRLALEDDEHYEALLADKSRTVLPSFEGENSTLRVLTKE